MYIVDHLMTHFKQRHKTLSWELRKQNWREAGALVPVRRLRQCHFLPILSSFLGK